MLWKLRSTPQFERDAKKMSRRSRFVAEQWREALKVLESDPYNTTGQYNIRKLKNVSAGQGQYRIRTGDYRLRYDIFADEVVLYAFAPRKDAY